MVLKYAAIPTPANTMSHIFIHSVVENVLAMLEIKDPDILYIGGSYDNSSQPNTTYGEQRDTSYGNTERIIIEVDEERNEESAFTRALGYDYNVPIFKDATIGASIAPNYVGYDVTITISRRAAARSMLGGWTNALQAKIDQGLDQFLTQGTLHYLIPNAAMNLTYALYQAKYSKLTPVPKFKDYLKRHLAPAVGVVSNMAGKQPEWVVRETECRLICFFTNDGIRRETANETGAFKSTFTVKFTYLRPEIMQLSYCPMVCNTLLDPKWWFDPTIAGLSDESHAVKDIYVDNQDKIIKQYAKVNLPVFLPECDAPDINLLSRQPEEIDLFHGYLELPGVVADKHLLFNLKELDDSYSLTYNQIKYIRKRLAVTNDHHFMSGLFRVTIYKNGYELRKSSVYLDESLDIWMLSPVDVKAVYNFSISLRTTFEGLSEEEQSIVAECPGIIKDILTQFHPDLVGTNDNVSIPNDQFYNPEFDDIRDYIPPFPDKDDPDKDFFPWRPNPDWPDFDPAEDEHYDPTLPIYPSEDRVVPGDLDLPISADIIDKIIDATYPNYERSPDEHYRNNIISQLNVMNFGIIAKRRQ